MTFLSYIAMAKLSKNIILIDTVPEDGQAFCRALSEQTQLEWSLVDYISNEGRTNWYANIIRYLKYFFFPLFIFFHRRNVDNIVAWQQFYGLIFAFYCRLFRVKKRQSLLIMTFIYKKKKGLVGKIYHKFIEYIVTGKYIDLIICTSDKERIMYSDLFGVSLRKFAFVPWGVLDHTAETCIDETFQERYIFSSGRSNRDWDFLISNVKNTDYKLKIACDELPGQIMDNVEIYDNIHGHDFFQYLRNCYCVVISLEDTNIAAGQTVLLYAMQFKKPLIITRSSGVTDDYIIDGYNGLIIEKKREELLDTLKKIYTDNRLYETLAANGYKEYQTKYSTSMLGENVGMALFNSGSLISA